MKVRPAALIVENDHVLLMRYRYGENDVFALPGGNPDRGETLTQTIERELSEELGIEVEVGEMFMLGEVLIRQRPDDVLHVVFMANIVGGLPKLNHDETTALEVLWQPLGTLHQKNLYPNINQAISEQRSGYIGKIDQAFF